MSEQAYSKIAEGLKEALEYAHQQWIIEVRIKDAAPELLAALKRFLDEYVALVESGDAGFWDVEQEEKVIQARAAISKATNGKEGDAN